MCCLSACQKDDSYLQIETLNTDGNEFFCNQKVKVWLCVHSSDLWHTDYHWTCDDGTLTQPQGLNEMTWKAPATPGVYTITCTASIGKSEDTRKKTMYVSSYYFEKFEKSSYTITLQSNNKNALKKESNGNQYLQIYVNSSSEYQRYIRRSFGDDALVTPFSTRMKIGFDDKNVPTTQKTKVGSKSGNSSFSYQWSLAAIPENENNYISQIKVEWFPIVPNDGYPAVPAGGTIIENSTVYNARVHVEQVNQLGKKTSVDEYRYVEGMNTFTANTPKTVSMGVDENKVLHMYVDGVETLTSDAVANLYETMQCKGGMHINNWDFYYLNGNGNKNVPKMYIDDAYASTTEMLK